MNAGATHLLVGPSGSGKTYRAAAMLRLKNELLRGGGQIRNVVVCYSAWQDVYADLDREGLVTRWVNKKPTAEEFVAMVEPYKESGGSLVVIDDFMSAIDKDLVEIVTVSARHNKATVFILFQSLFPSNPLARQISLNVKYIYVHKNPRENAQIQYLARQLRPRDYKWVVEAYHEATREPYSCFLIDLTQEQSEHLRFRSRFLPHEFPMKVWLPKDSSALGAPHHRPTTDLSAV